MTPTPTVSIIAIDCRPLCDNSASRGVGFVVRHLIPELAKCLPGMVLYTETITPEIGAFGLPILENSTQMPLQKFLQAKCVSHFHFMAQYNVPLDFNLPHSITVHDLFNRYRGINSKKDFKLQLRLVQRLKNAKLWFTVSQFTKDELVANHSFPENRIVVTYPGAMMHLSKYADQQLPRPAEYPDPFILTIGNFEARKNQRNMIAATIKLNRNRTQKMHYVAVQTWDPTLSLLAAKIKVALAGQSRYFHFLGRVSESDLAALYQHTSLFSFVSKAEGFGLPILEAMQFDIPILTSTQTAMPEVGLNGVEYADPENISEIAAQMEKCLTHPITPELKALRKTIIQGFSVSNMAKIMAKHLSDFGV